MSASRSFPFPSSASHKLRTGLIVLAMCSGLLAVVAPGPAAAGPAHTAKCGTLWSTVPSPTPKAPTRGAGLTGVAAVSPTDAWAVTTRGIEHSDGGAWKRWRFSVPGVLTGISAVSADDVWAVGFSSPPGRTLTVHWNGSAWSVVPSPNLGVGSNRLSAVSARAADDVWAVGQDFNGVVEQTLIEHWDGSEWSIVPSPNLGDGNNQLYAVTALDANDVWAVGSAGVSYDTSNVALHWDGTEWQLVATPDQDEVNALTGVSGSASDDVWAVGNFGGHSVGAILLHWNGTEWKDDSTDALPPPTAVVALSGFDAWAVGNGGIVLQWDGASWGDVSTPAREQGAPLDGVAATSAADVWAVGASRDISPAFGFAEHFDGSTWKTQTTPTNETHDGELLAIGAIDEENLWSVGQSRVQKDPVIEHWNGRAWSIVPGPSVDASASGLRSVSVVSASSVWAAGWADQASLIEHYDSMSWQVVDVPSVGALRGIAALSDDDVWAAGPGFFLHYDGHAWSQVASPIVNMSGLAAISPSDLYAVSADGSIAHFDGASWTLSYGPHAGRALFTVTASGPDDVWALGKGKAALHFDGASWTRVAIPIARQELGSSAVDPAQTWAAGWHHKRAVVQRWDGMAWTQDFAAASHSRFDAVAALPSGDVWAVGVSQFFVRYTYVLHGVVCGNQAPVVTPPSQTFVDGSHVVSDKPATVPLHLAWTGSDDDSIASYQLQVSVNGGDFAPVHLDDPATPAATVDVFTGTTYVFRADATDSHGLTGDWATGPMLSPGGSQNATTHGGSWRTRVFAGDWMGSDQYTREHGAFARFTFTGQGVAWIGPTGLAYGAADVYIDGVKITTVNQFSGTRQDRAVLFSTVWASTGPHAITIVSRGTTGHPRTSIDGFFVLH